MIGGKVKNPVRYCWLVALVAGLGLALAVIGASASIVPPPSPTGAPGAVGVRSATRQDVELLREQVSTEGQFGAYPDIAADAGGLVVLVWTEGADPVVEKHNGPLKMAWVTSASIDWAIQTLDNQVVYDAAVAVAGSKAYIVWSRNKVDIYYTVCTPSASPPSAGCAPASKVVTAMDKALQVDIVVDNGGNPHLVWVEQDNMVYYTRAEGGTWRQKQALPAHITPPGGEGPALAFAGNTIFLVWTEWQDESHTNSDIRFCRRSVNDADWSGCRTLANWGAGDYLARNPSVAADGTGNVYAVWDLLSDDDGGSQRQYAIGYRHSDDNGANWHSVHTFPGGNEFGQSESGTRIFRSVGGIGSIEYIQHLRPYVSMAVSGTVKVPVLAWHAEIPSGDPEERLAEHLQLFPHKVFWAFATKPGSYAVPYQGDGYLYWATEVMTVSTNMLGQVAMGVNSASGAIAPVGDLKQILADEPSNSYLHAAYHEEMGGGFWGVLYNNTAPVTWNKVFMPMLMRGTGDTALVQSLLPTPSLRERQGRRECETQQGSER